LSLCSLSYLGGVLGRESAISCGSDAVTDPVTGWIITPLPHDIAQMLTSSHLNRNLSICSRCRCCFCRRRYHPFFTLYFHPWKCGLLSSITLVFIVSILGTKDTTPRLLRLFSRHINSGSCGVIRLIFLGGGWPDDVRFPRRSGDSPPLVIIWWAEDVLIMRQAMML
jgi:hypothetical protein